jgi:hypothetical protein
MNRNFAPAIIGLVALAAVGCGGSADGRPRTWSYISPVIIQPNCATANCHSQLTQRAGYDFSTADKTSRGAVVLQGFATVAPMGDPKTTILSQLLRGTFPGYQRMPPDFPLADADIELIEGWSANGASLDGATP